MDVSMEHVYPCNKVSKTQIEANEGLLMFTGDILICL